MEDEKLPDVLKRLENKMLYLRPVPTTHQLKKVYLEPPKSVKFLDFTPWLLAAIVMIIVTLWSAHENYKMEKMIVVRGMPNSFFNAKQKMIEIENGTEKKSLVRIHIQVTKKTHGFLNRYENYW